MELKYTNRFLRDLKKYKDEKDLIQIIGKKANGITKASSADDIHELVRIRKTSSHYRIKIKISDKTVYRLGIIILRNTVWLASIESDKRRFYKNFP